MLLSKSLHIVSTYMDKAEFVWALLKSRPSPAGRVSDSIKLVVDKITLRFPRIRSINRFRTRTPGVWFNRELSLLANPWKISVISLSNTCKNACKFIIKIINSQTVFRLKNLFCFSMPFSIPTFMCILRATIRSSWVYGAEATASKSKCTFCT